MSLPFPPNLSTEILTSTGLRVFGGCGDTVPISPRRVFVGYTLKTCPMEHSIAFPLLS